MADKSLLIVIDSFSDRVADYSNVTLYDYGQYQKISYIDNAFSPTTASYTGYGNIDNFVLHVADSGSFQWVTHDSDTTPTLDLDYETSGQFIGWDGNTAYYNTYWQFDRLNQNDETSPNHGDWVVEAINQTLDDPSSTQILAIDVDTLNGLGSRFDNLFRYEQIITLSMGSWYGTVLEGIVARFLDLFDSRFADYSNDTFMISGLSVSISGAPATTREMAVFSLLEDNNIPIFQAAPNVNQGAYDWGSNYVDVINVGAWNTDVNGDLLVSSVGTIGTVDLVADGYLVKGGWGWNFGTSFATPKVAASFTNVVNSYIASLTDSGSSIENESSNSSDVNIDYSTFMNSITDYLTTAVEVHFDDPSLDDLWNSTYEYVRLLNDTIEENGYLPLTLSGISDGGIDGTNVATAGRYDFEATASNTYSGNAVEGGTVTSNITNLSDVDGNVTFTYQWQVLLDSVWTDILGAETDTLAITEDQSMVGKTYRVSIETFDSLGGTTHLFASSFTVQNVNDDPTGTVKINGIAEEGQELTASNTLADEDGLGTINYQWNRDGTPISGATTTSYTLTKSDVGKAITVTASYTDNESTLESVTSSAKIPGTNNNLNTNSYIAISGTTGDDHFEGGIGVDIAIVNSTRKQSSIVFIESNVYSVLSKDGSDTLTNIERIQFSDANIALDTDGATSAGGIYRLYKATFNREPDHGGLGYWIAQADAGSKTAVQMAEDFTWSTEFQELYDITTSDNYGTGTDVSNLVTGFYQNVLGRAPDQGGLDYYSGVIQTHEKTVGRVLAEISDSQENYDNTIDLIQNGIQYDLWVG